MVVGQATDGGRGKARSSIYQILEELQMKDCPNCGSLLERADYLEGKNGFEEPLVCMECDDD
ncbi:MAG: hypothetical protein ACQEXQ_27160 [Bacillota bacterium]